jgi:hypothetical protein
VGPAATIRILTADPHDPLAPAAGEVLLRGEEEGDTLAVVLRDLSAGKRPKSAGGATYHYWRTYQPKKSRPAAKAVKVLTEADRARAAKKARENLLLEERRAASALENQQELLAAGRQHRTATDHWIPVAIDVDALRAAVWVEGCFVGQLELPAGAHGAVSAVLPTGYQVRHAQLLPPRESLLLPLDLSAYTNDHFSAAPGAPPGGSRIEVGGIEFRLPGGPQNQVNLRPVDWLERKADGNPWSTEGYDLGPRFAFDPRMPVLRVPCVDYLAAHVLAVADDDPKLTSRLTLRPRTSGQGPSLQFDFSAAVPRQSELTIDARKLTLTHIVVPLGAVAQDLRARQYGARPNDVMEIELSKEIRVAVRAPDGHRWRYRPLGLPSGVRIAAITLEKAPLQMRVTSTEVGHIFVQPAKPVF